MPNRIMVDAHSNGHLLQLQPQSLDYGVSPVGDTPTSRRQLGLDTMLHVTGDPSLPQTRTDLQA